MYVSFNGDLLRLARQYRGFNQRDLALKLSVEPSTVSRVENGVIDRSPEFIERSAFVLGMPQ